MTQDMFAPTPGLFEPTTSQIKDNIDDVEEPENTNEEED